MFTGEFKFDLNDALDGRLPQYCNAYHTTNEPIEDWLKLTPVKNARVLTVAASGDQPLMYAGAGASHIDTFDITLNACAIMDFKTTALGGMNLSDYAATVQDLTNLDKLDMRDPRIMRIMSIAGKMPQRTRTLMFNLLMHRKRAFTQHSSHKVSFPSAHEMYTKMQATAHEPFNFIWADLENVSHYIDGKYDIINISNIFDHYLQHKESPIFAMCNTIANLWPHLNPTGNIICTTSAFALGTPEIIEQIPELLQSQSRMKVSFPAHDPMLPFVPIVIQKAR